MYIVPECNLIFFFCQLSFSSSKPVWFGVALPFTNDNKENNHPQGDYDGSSYSNGDGSILYRDDNDFDGKLLAFEFEP